jgi:NAD(P)-dependent dehydrogenase (short-subunit alcohol dehydrogenase family)
MARFTDKTVFITGGASGFGALAAEGFADEGANVVVGDINRKGVEKVAAALPHALAIELDVTDVDAVGRAMSETVDAYGRVDVIFNNAGVDDLPVPLHETSQANWNRVSGVNGDGAFNVLRAGISAMLDNDSGGSVVNTVSIAGMIGIGGLTPYTYSKGGLIALTRSAAAEYAARNIRVNAIAPGATLTPLLEHFISLQEDPPAFRQRIESDSPLPGFVSAKSVVRTALFLASDDAASITGITIPVDNGQTVI